MAATHSLTSRVSLSSLSGFFFSVGAAASQAVGGSRILASSFSADASHSVSAERTSEYEWCSDSGTNRFVTNDERDYVPGSIVYLDTVVSVGGGTIISPMQGTVLIRSLDHPEVVIQCNDVLLLEHCAKKLMPVSNFTCKGCHVVYSDGKVSLTNAKDQQILSGKRFDGLFYFRTETVHNIDSAGPAPSVSLQTTKVGDRPTTCFALKPGKISADGQDFPRALYEAHVAYGHMNFTKLRTMLGLKKGSNPHCEACAIANSRKSNLGGIPYDRATTTLQRTFIDMGFTGINGTTFQLYIDDHDRVSHLDVLENGKGACLPAWVELKGHEEAEHYPAKVAIIRTDSEPCYQTQGWIDHCRKENITHEQSSRHRHDQNGVVERGMGVIGVPFRCMMITGNAPEADAPHALRYANVIRNHSPTKANGGWTPREKRCGMKLPINERLLR